MSGNNHEKLKEWCLCSYSKFLQLAENSEHTGVYIKERILMYSHMIDSKATSKTLKHSLKKYTRGFRHDKNLLKENGVSMEYGVLDAMATQIPVIETDMFMYWLTQQCISKGVDFMQGTVDSLQENCDSLKRTHGVECIVNCTELAAGKLVQDDAVYPLLGVALTLRREDSKFELPKCVLGTGRHATGDEHDWYEETTNVHGTPYIIPRGEHSLWIGTMLLESYDKNIGLKHPAVQKMLEECQAVYPPLRNINQDDLHVTVGIRPMRRGGPRVQQDPRCPFLIHNYGHGSFGVMTSWGCASDVLGIVKKSSRLFSKL